MVGLPSLYKFVREGFALMDKFSLDTLERALLKAENLKSNRMGQTSTLWMLVSSPEVITEGKVAVRRPEKASEIGTAVGIVSMASEAANSRNGVAIFYQ